MNYRDYKELHKRLVAENKNHNHNKPAYLEYTRLNWQRIKRWEKQAKLSEEQVDWLKKQTNTIKMGGTH